MRFTLRTTATRLTGGTAVVVAALLLGGCSASSASASNFTRAINAYYAQPDNCFAIPLPARSIFHFNAKTSSWPVWIADSDAAKSPPRFLAAWVKDGYMTAHAHEGFAHDAIVPGKRYAFTRKGRRVLHSTGASIHDSVCVGEFRVAKVLNWTTPGQNGPGVASEVTFTLRLGTFYPWLRHSALYAIYDFHDVIAAPSKTQTTVILTHNGWQVSD